MNASFRARVSQRHALTQAGHATAYVKKNYKLLHHTPSEENIAG